MNHIPASDRQAIREHLEIDLKCKLLTGDLFLDMVIEQEVGTKEWHWRFANGKKVVTFGGAAFFNANSAVRMLARKLADEAEDVSIPLFFNRIDIRGGTLKDD